MNTVSLLGSVSRCAGGLFESVRRLHQELLATTGRQFTGSNLASSKAQQEIQVNVLGMVDEFTAADLKAWAPVPVYPSPILGPRTFGYAPGLTARLQQLNPDLLHVHGLWQFPSLAALWWHRRSRKPYIISPHGMVDPWALKNHLFKKRLAWFAYEHEHLSRATCVRALCQSEANAIRALGIDKPICVLPNGVDLPAMTAGKENSRLPESSLAALDGHKVLLYLGRIHPKKGLVPLLQAWARVQQRREDWTLVIAGWDQNGHESELKRMVDELNLSWCIAFSEVSSDTSIIFPGPQFGRAKHQWLQRCQALILPSFSEGLPMAVLEAWAFAKPTLISTQCHLPEGIAAGAAFPLEPDTCSIATALLDLFSTDPTSLECMGRCGLALVSNQFAWSKIAAELRNVYLWMLGSGPKPDRMMDA